MPLPEAPQATCHACNGCGFTVAFTKCVSCDGAGGWPVKQLLRCGRCGGKMAIAPEKTDDGAIELSCITCGHCRYLTVTPTMASRVGG